MAHLSARSKSLSSSQQTQTQRLTNDPLTNRTTQNTVTCLYQTHIAGFWRNVTVTWSKNLMNCSVNLAVESIAPDQVYNCKIELKPWQFWSKKGYKTFDVDGHQLEAYWDVRSAKFYSGSPEPASDYYVALVSDEEVVLLLGDYKKKAYKITKARPGLVEAMMFNKKEHVFGKKSFSTRATFDQDKREHDIVVESSTTGPREPEMWISIDGIVLIHVTNLQWKFRGNQTIQVNKQPVQVFWDVHPWLFCEPGLHHGLFIFKPGAPDSESDEEDNSQLGEEGSDCSGNSRYFSTLSYSKASKFCLFLYAWKIE